MSDQRIFEAKPRLGTVLKIGEAPENKIEIDVKYKGSDTPKIRATVTAYCGQTPNALVASANAVVTVTSDLGDFSKLESEDSSSSNEKVSWATSSFGIELKNKEFSISLTGFACSTPPGKAAIELNINEWDDTDLYFKPLWSSKPTLEIDKAEPPAAGLAYFTIAPSFVLRAGVTDVTLAILAKGYKSATLRRNNEEVAAWRRQCDEIARGEAAEFTDRPSITTVYRLELADEKGAQFHHDRTVQVIASGWNRLALPQGYPAWLFDAPDFSGSGRRLYGIFIDANGRATLHSSATGVDNWHLEAGEVPQHMKHSPGVVFKNKLWLTGGSSFDQNEPRNRPDPRDQVWCYEKNEDTKAWRWVEKQELSLSRVGARACHACVVVATPEGEEQLWILGGVHRGAVYKDVWTCDGVTWRKVDENWDGRYLHAATARRTGSAAEVWVYGGQGGDPNRRSDLLVRNVPKGGGGNWSSGVRPEPLPGEGIAVALTTAPRMTIGKDRPIMMLGTFVPRSPGNVSVSRILKWQERK